MIMVHVKDYSVQNRVFTYIKAPAVDVETLMQQKKKKTLSTGSQCLHLVALSRFTFTVIS